MNEFPWLTSLAVFVLASIATALLNKIAEAQWINSYAARLVKFSTLLIWGFLLGALLVISSQYSLSYLYIELGFIAIFVVGARHWLVEIASGIILAVENRFSMNELINIEDSHQGRIIEFRLRHLTIELQDGAHVDIPYSQLIDKTVRHLGSQQQPDCKLKLDLPKNISMDRAIDKARKAISLSPLLAPSKSPEVFIEDKDDKLHLIIKGRAFDSSLQTHLKSDVTERFYKLLEE